MGLGSLTPLCSCEKFSRYRIGLNHSSKTSLSIPSTLMTWFVMLTWLSLCKRKQNSSYDFFVQRPLSLSLQMPLLQTKVFTLTWLWKQKPELYSHEQEHFADSGYPCVVTTICSLVENISSSSAFLRMTIHVLKMKPASSLNFLSFLSAGDATQRADSLSFWFQVSLIHVHNVL